MDKEKQIEEMFNIIVDGIIDGEDNNGVPTGNTCSNIAESIYAQGYRKQSEVAREILDAIKEKLIFNTYGIATISDKTFCELKKKYTEYQK